MDRSVVQFKDTREITCTKTSKIGASLIWNKLNLVEDCWTHASKKNMRQKQLYFLKYWCMKQPGKVLSSQPVNLPHTMKSLTLCSIINSDHIKAVLSSICLIWNTQGIIHDSTKLHHMRIKFIYFNCIFSVLVRWLCLLHPTAILSIFPCWLCKSVWKWNICK